MNMHHTIEDFFDKMSYLNGNIQTITKLWATNVSYILWNDIFCHQDVN